jgi:hypothetical protein
MSSVVSSSSVDSATVVVPLGRHQDESSECVFALQPINTSYGHAARAIACSLLYRFLRVNTGYGCSQTDFYQPEGADSLVSTSITALKAHDTPGHCIQVLTAEWLIVWSALKTRYPDAECNFRMVAVSGDDMATAKCVNSPQDLLEQMDTLQHDFKQGDVIVSPAALLTFCANWFGRMHVLKHVEKDEKEAANVRASLFAMLPSSAQGKSTLGSLFQWGSVNVANSSTALFGALQSIFTHSIALQIVHVDDSSSAHVESLAQISSRVPSVALNRDAPLYGSSANAKTYSKFTSTASQYETMLTFNAITVAIATGTGAVVGSVLPWASEDSPLQPFMLQCAATAALKQLGSTKRSRTDAEIVTRHVWRLFPGIEKRTVVAAVYAAVRLEFGGPVDSDASIVSAQTTTSVVRDASSTLSAAAGLLEGRPVYPGRLFTEGSPSIALLFSKIQLYSKHCAKSLKCLKDFLASRSAVRDEETRRTFVQDGKGKLLFEFLRKDSEDPQVYLFTPRPGSDDLIPKLNPVSKQPLWGVTFPFCHLLWLAMDSNPRVHQIIRDLHEKCAVYGHDLDEATEVSDAQKHKIVHDILNRDLSTCLTWFPEGSGSTLTMWFSFDDGTAHQLVLALESYAIPRVVAKLVDASIMGESTEYIIGEFDATTENVVVSNILRPRKKSAGLVKKSSIAVVIEKDSVADCSSRSLPRRVAFTTTHVMLMQLFSGREEVKALQTFLEFCQPETGREDVLRADAENNKEELVQRLQQYRKLLGNDAEDGSAISVDSTATLTA